MARFDWNNAQGNAHADELARVIDRFAAGDYTATLHSGAGPAARIVPALQRLQAELVRRQDQSAAQHSAQQGDVAAFAATLDQMTQAHAAGEIDMSMPADTLAEPYCTLAIKVNALVKSHIDIKMQVVDLVGRYAQGDFSVEMARLPGKKAQITAAMDRAKTTFAAVASEAVAGQAFIVALEEMSKSHALGWIDESIAATRLSGTFARAAELINALVRSHIDVKMQIVDLVTAYAAGDFSRSIDRLPGKKAQITAAIDRAKETFEVVVAQAAESTSFIRALEEVSKQHKLGWIDEQIPVSAFSGEYEHAAELVNNLVRSHIDVKMQIVDLVMRYARGDFSVSMDRLPGKKAKITEAIDEAKATFEAVAAQVTASEKFIAALAEMTRQHELGWIDEQIAVTDFSGNFQRAAHLVNTLVRAHIDIKMKVVDLVTRYARGDFSITMERLPGKKAAITDAMDQVKSLLQTCDLAVNDVVRVLAALAKGDLTEVITNDYDGLFARIKSDSNATVENLTKTVVDIKEAAEIVSTSAREIAAGNIDLSQRTELQAASLEETAASIEELTATVRQNTENAKQANQLAFGASSIAVKGGAVVGEVVHTMAAINASAKKIVDIISVIDGIAFQTNILALNAAVEAARAGEQGRGFAVVAGEVRTLAQRSAAAAKEIKELIGDSVDKTTAGSKLVDQAGITMEEIVASVKRVTEIMGEIANASVEQGIGIEQVNEAIGQMDKVTQQNAVLVEQVSASAQALEERAQSLVGLVGIFSIADFAHQGANRQSMPHPAPKPVVSSKRNSTAAAPNTTPRPALTAATGAEWNAF